jgi:precorrin-2/cobalt-factor-2 C20-methyltransferase
MRLTGVGVGPGDPELLTLKGQRLLGEADVVFVPVAAGPAPAGQTHPGARDGGEPGYAERVVLAQAGSAHIQRLAFSLAEDPDSRAASWAGAADAVAAAVDGGRHAAFATLGDPAVYATFAYVAAAVAQRRPQVAIDTVPGVTAAQDLAARAGVSIVEGEETLALLPITAGQQRFTNALAEHDAVIAYKGGARLAEVRAALAEAGRADDAVYGARLGLPDQVVGGLPAQGAGPYLSTVIVAPSGRRRSRRD